MSKINRLINFDFSSLYPNTFKITEDLLKEGMYLKNIKSGDVYIIITYPKEKQLQYYLNIKHTKTNVMKEIEYNDYIINYEIMSIHEVRKYKINSFFE